MADTMQLLTVASVAGTTFARLAKGLVLALAVVASIAAAPRSAAADETLKASRQTSAVAAPSGPVVAGRQRILAHPTDPDPASAYVEKLYKELMRSTPR